MVGGPPSCGAGGRILALQIIVLAATLTTLTAFGINVQPLLTFGSIGTVAVGFAAQSTMQNVVSALQIVSVRESGAAPLLHRRPAC